MGKKSSFEIILGSYEEYIVAYTYSKKEEELCQSFATHSHCSSVRCIAASKNLLATGAADDRIVVYDLKSRKELVMLTYHNDTVNCLQFTPENTHLISGGQDGLLAIVRVGNWKLEKTFHKAHKGQNIINIAVHSSGKLALSLGGDYTLRTWNLVKGRLAYIINLNTKNKNPSSLHSIKWAPDDNRFALVGGNSTDIWSLKDGDVLKEVEHKSRVTSTVWATDETLLVGYEEGKICSYSLENNTMDFYEAHESRVKCLSFYKNRIISGSSSGVIKIWNLNMDELCSVNTGCRFTCLAIAPIIKNKIETVAVEEEKLEVEEVKVVKKKKRVVVYQEESSENGSIKKKKKSKISKDESVKSK